MSSRSRDLSTTGGNLSSMRPRRGQPDVPRSHQSVMSARERVARRDNRRAHSDRISHRTPSTTGTASDFHGPSIPSSFALRDSFGIPVRSAGEEGWKNSREEEAYKGRTPAAYPDFVTFGLAARSSRHFMRELRSHASFSCNMTEVATSSDDPSIVDKGLFSNDGASFSDALARTCV